MMGRHGLGQMNENGEMFADLCASNRLVIGGSMYPHKRVHKATWISPDHITENQIHHICIGQKFRRSLQDVCVKRGADAASDHHLVLAKMKLKLKKSWSVGSTRIKYNVEFLKDRETAEKYHVTLSHKYQVLQELYNKDDIDLHAQWQQAKEIWTSTCEETLGKRKLQQKEWISAETLQKLEEGSAKQQPDQSSKSNSPGTVL